MAVADQQFSKAVSEGSEAAFGFIQRGLFQLRLDQFSEAAQSFQTAAEKEPKNPAPLFFLSLSRELEGDAAEADASLEKLSKLCPHHQGLVSLRLLKELRRGNPLPILHLLGFGENAKAYSPVRMAIAGLGVGDPKWLPPDLSSSAYLLGPILVEVEKRLLAREVEALERREGDLLKMLSDLEPPRRSLSEEVKGLKASWKGAPRLRKGRRLLERAMGLEDAARQKAMLAEAIVHLEAGHALDPFSFRTGYHLGEAYLFQAKGAPGHPYERDSLLRAETWFVDSARIDGLNPYVLFYLAFVQQLLGRPQAAIDCYLKATEKFTKLPEAHYGMGQCHLLLGDFAQARELMLKAANSDLALARERLILFANLLGKEGEQAFARPLPTMPEPSAASQAETMESATDSQPPTFEDKAAEDRRPPDETSDSVESRATSSEAAAAPPDGPPQP